MTVGADHPWPASPRQAVAIQKRLAPQVVPEWSGPEVSLVAGTDCAYSKEGPRCAGAVVVWSLEKGEIVEESTACTITGFPYLPGLLAFREAPVVLEALERLDTRPQLLICDGHGIAHPRRFGLACHLGLLSGIPTIGCAKRRLCGTFIDPDCERGSSSPLTDRGEIVGAVLRTRSGVKPVFVSIGHRIDLTAAKRVVLDCARRYRLPEPLRTAHAAALRALIDGN